jgi:hypothetical protein
MNFKTLVQEGINKLRKNADVEADAELKNLPNNVFHNVISKAIQNNQVAKEEGPFYSVSAENWYKTFPYRFRMEIDGMPTFYSLPIPPEALSYQMVNASQLIPTMGGVVEETSATTFWQITLSGTTGIAIARKYSEDPNVGDMLDVPASKESSFRRVLKGGVLANTFNKAANVYEAVTGAYEDGPMAAVGLLEGLASTAQRYNSSAVPTKIPEESATSRVANALGVDLSRFTGKGELSTNGFVEIHLLHNFLNAYSHIKEVRPDTVKLFFESHKDNMQWQVIVRGFSFQKNAAQPYLYKYNIALQGFDLKEVGAGIAAATDRFGADGDLGSVNSFTLTGALERANSLTRKLFSKDAIGLIASKPPII